ncbi:hypothetical protein HHK36_025211 [Tetracentron sinense]|uniref:Uncharacterized protein n=1 Tax=Tetracentron sinense TaxID=13715 RepID=A0A834YKP5_TETSI|nr:hypothetical protein HHK36_025211 [Tetracentron sinense]
MNNSAVSFNTRISKFIKASENLTLSPRLHRPPEFLHLSLLKKCTHLIQFKQIHTQIIKNPSHQTDSLLPKLVEMLVSLNQLDYARLVFDQMVEPTTFVFNTMVRGYAVGCAAREGFQLYIQMRYRGLEPDTFTYPFLLRACTALSQGKAVHCLILKTQGFGSHIYSQTSLISFYSSHGEMKHARQIFDRMPQRNVVSWTAIITGYVKHNKRYKDGLALFHQMQTVGTDINELTLVTVLSACAHIGAFEMGKWIHGYIERTRIFLNSTLATALLDMYAKCGYINTASRVFEMLPQRSVCTWNSIIVGLGMHGYGDEALERFEQMQRSGTRPDSITFIGVLSACSHSGMVEKGREYFYSMSRDFGIEPNIKHYGCLVDLLGRAGLLDEAYEIVRNMPIEPNGVLWGTLLNACAAHTNVELAETAMEHLIKLEPFNDGNYVLMSNIYAAKGQWNDVAKMRRFMKDSRILKTPGCSLIEINNVVHEFTVGDTVHPQSKEIYSMLYDVVRRLKTQGYIPKTQ